MKNYAMFWHSAILNYLGQILEIVEKYNKQMNINSYSLSDIDFLLYNTENYETIQSVCFVMEIIFSFITTEMADYISSNMNDFRNENNTLTCVDKLKTFIDKYVSDRRI